MVFKKKRHSDGHWVLTGEIVSGAREAVFFTQLDWVQEQCKTKLGFKPYPGTLNLEINKEKWSVVEYRSSVHSRNFDQLINAQCSI